MPDTQIILNAIGNVDKRLGHVHDQVDDLVKETGTIKADVSACKVKIEGIDKRIDGQNGKIAANEKKAEEAILAASNARSLWIKRGTIIAVAIGAIGALGAAAIEAWGGF